MKIIDAPQGSPAWHAHRNSNTFYNASESPAMMGESPYQKRSELLAEKAGAISREIDAATQKRFDDGHRFEALARPHAERFIGDDIYPITGVEGPYSASFDGLTEDYMTAFEHKSLNDTIRACSCAAELPAYLRIQMEHQLMVCGGERVFFMASKWDDDDELVEEKHFYYEPDLALRKKIEAGWKQFAADLANYQHVEVIPSAVATPQMALPAVVIQVEGAIALRDNLDVFGDALRAYVGRINKKPQTDQDFADLDASAKLLREVQAKIAAARDGALGQIESIDAMKRTADVLEELARTTAVEVEKLVKAEKENRRNAIIQKAKDKLQTRIAKHNERFGKSYMPPIVADFAGKAKGLKSIASIQNAVDTELARATIEANDIANGIDANLMTLREIAGDHKFLFADTPTIVMKNTDDLTALVKSRIADHKEAEAKAARDAEIRAINEKRVAENTETVATPTAAPAEIPSITAAVPIPTLPTTSPASASGGARTRPTDDDIIDVLALHYRVHESKVIEWLLAMNLTAASERMTKEFAA